MAGGVETFRGIFDGADKTQNAVSVIGFECPRQVACGNNTLCRLFRMTNIALFSPFIRHIADLLRFIGKGDNAYLVVYSNTLELLLSSDARYSVCQIATAILQHAVVGSPFYQVTHFDGIANSIFPEMVAQKIDIDIYYNSKGNDQQKTEEDKKLCSDGIGNSLNTVNHNKHHSYRSTSADRAYISLA
jgi:hypothetical protein